MYSTQGFRVWSSENSRTRTYHKKKKLEYYQGIQFGLELTDEGELKVVAHSKWQAIPEEYEVVWSSTYFQLETESVGQTSLTCNQVFGAATSLLNSVETHRLLFNDVLGTLQIWKRALGNQAKLSWQSQATIEGDPPWNCVLSSIGLLVTLDRRRRCVWASNYIDSSVLLQSPPTLTLQKNFLHFYTQNREESSLDPLITVCLSDNGELQLKESSESLPYWQTFPLRCPSLFCDSELATYVSSSSWSGEEKEKMYKTNVSGVGQEWFESVGYKRVLDRTCLVGNDFLISHQRLIGLSETTSIQLLPQASSRLHVESVMWLNAEKAEVSYIQFLKPVSIFVDNFLDSRNQPLVYPILSNDSYIAQETDHPLLLFLHNKCLTLTTFHGTLIAKKRLDLLFQKFLVS